MEFRKREVKRPEPPTSTMKSGDGDVPKMPPPPAEKYSFDDKVIVVSVICEAFEIQEINLAESKGPVPVIGKNYIQDTRIRNMMYDISSEGTNKIKQITQYWNEWSNVGGGRGRKISFSIRTNTNNKKEAVEVK